MGTQTIFVKTLNSLQLENKVSDLASWWPVLTQWTPDGKNLLSEESTADTRRLRIIETPLSGQAPALSLLEDPIANVASGCVSPDGRWLAYRSTETGRSKAYVTSFPKPSGKIQVSTSGASAPRWRGDSKELYFLDWNHQMMAAELAESGGSLRVTSLRSLFRVRALSSLRSTHYDVSQDGNRYAVLSVSDDEISTPLNVVVNWSEELKRK